MSEQRHVHAKAKKYEDKPSSNIIPQTCFHLFFYFFVRYRNKIQIFDLAAPQNGFFSLSEFHWYVYVLREKYTIAHDGIWATSKLIAPSLGSVSFIFH